jgi:hypothetical protein
MPRNWGSLVSNALDATHDRRCSSWVESANDPASEFPDPEPAVRPLPASRRYGLAHRRRDRRQVLDLKLRG